ncbi:hypothetical protein KCU93_g442, partial [Aureobasidium melanogenum]
MYAKLHGRRPILVTMGLDALSENWSRLLKFVDRYTSQYGKLEFAVRVNSSEATGAHGESSQEICPTKIDPHYFGFYDSKDFALHNSGVEDNQSLAEWEERINVLQATSLKSTNIRNKGSHRVEGIPSKRSKAHPSRPLNHISTLAFPKPDIFSILLDQEDLVESGLCTLSDTLLSMLQIGSWVLLVVEKTLYQLFVKDLPVLAALCVVEGLVDQGRRDIVGLAVDQEGLLAAKLSLDA